MECAVQSIVLLKNKDSILPLDDTIKRICVCGPNADNIEAQLGDWSFHSVLVGLNTEGHPRKNIVTGLDGIKKRAGEKREIYYCKGCSVIDDGYDEIETAAELASTSDIAVVVVGDTLPLIGETHDRATLDLTGKQLALVQAIFNSGIPFMTVLINSKPFSIPWIKEHSNAIIETWNPGMEGGNAIAQVLFRDVNPSRKLTISFLQYVGHIPVNYN